MLTIYEKHPTADAYRVGGFYSPYALVATEKRFTGPELAAEYWRLRLKVCASGNRDMKAKGHVCAEWQAAHDELDTMQRFATLPHFDA